LQCESIHTVSADGALHEWGGLTVTTDDGTWLVAVTWASATDAPMGDKQKILKGADVDHLPAIQAPHA
jgi:hypothetical protein